jgi:uncharacterized membrane protein YeiB
LAGSVCPEQTGFALVGGLSQNFFRALAVLTCCAWRVPLRCQHWLVTTIRKCAMSRIVALDVIRGLAILGILLLNIYSFSRPVDFSHSLLWTQAGYSALDELLYALQTLFFTGRFLTLFNLLFGVSLVLIADRYGLAYLRRRLQWLALFGLLHACLIWEGDILLWYALSGLIVLRLGYLSLSSEQLWRKGLILFGIGLIVPLPSRCICYPLTILAPSA